MTSEGPIDLIRLEGEGNSVIVRITGRKPAYRPIEFRGKEPANRPIESAPLVGEITVDTPFVRGATPTWVSAKDLEEWQDALDALDAGGDIGWREGGRGPEMFIELDPDGDRAHVSVSDLAGALTTVTVTVTISDAWFDDAYERLAHVRQTWPSARVDTGR